MLELVKIAMRLTTDAYDDELNNLINAALKDLGVAGVINLEETDALIIEAVTTYCKLNFGNPSNYDKLERSYREQKAQLSTSDLYGDFE